MSIVLLCRTPNVYLDLQCTKRKVMIISETKTIRFSKDSFTADSFKEVFQPKDSPYISSFTGLYRKEASLEMLQIKCLSII